MTEWMDDFDKGFLKITDDGKVHEVVILSKPEQSVNKNSGEQQWVFDAQVDGVTGFLAPGTRLGRVISAKFKENGEEWPVKFKVERTGMGPQDTVFRVVE